MVITKLKLGTVALLAAILVAGGTAVHALQSPGTGGTDVHAEGRPTGAENQPREEPLPEAETTSQPASVNSDLARDELDLLALQLAKKKAEIAKAEAQKQFTVAIVASHKRLNARRPGMVSVEEILQAESEVESASATVEVAKTELQEVELRIQQLSRIQRNPEQLREHLARSRGAELAPLERRMERLEQKLDQILKALTSTPAPASSKPGGDARP